MENNADGLLIARICHDLKNCLSVVAFFKEDLLEGTVDPKEGLDALVKSVDKLNLRLSFFQNLAVDGSHIGNLYDMLRNMCIGHDIKLEFDITSIDPENDGIIQNIVCGILYLIVVDALRSGSARTITAVSSNQAERIEITISDMTVEDLPSEVLDISEMDTVNVTVVNALALYIKRVLTRHGYVANIFDELDDNSNSNVKIVLKKLI